MQEGFSRPSFYVNLVQEIQTDKNKAFYARSITINITYYAPLNSISNYPDRAQQYSAYETLRSLFSSSYFQVGSKVVKIRQLTGGPKGKEIYLGLNLDIKERRTVTSSHAAIMNN
jgi:hypothetical protein